MAFQDKEILRDKNGKPIPQVWNEDIQDYEPYDPKNHVTKVKDEKLNDLETKLDALITRQDGEYKTKLTGSNIENVTFHNAATTPAKGNEFDVGGFKTLTISIRGTSTSRTLQFKTVEYDGFERTIAGLRMSDFKIDTQTTGNSEIWQFDVTGLNKVIVDLTAVSGGSVFVKGRVVA
ncbi:hypothetical protein [Evansella cellulosilytica]|uniref:Uncharacterized protein n=1 Tax=Evansella cellulosilytica (strain ATCC 21833 / DSM 2522 / FERM P-1141 / JCM 9156 / N-4) TaxID=649639 RepID=E6U1K8_EVAC2|nr:hypothetical protein [Evansella cellulosilytica]ADU30371.1 hypothetical protein Bcell_2110 [Evansella cellulosilytica DSM 2522]